MRIMPRVCGVSGTTLAGKAVSVMSASKRMFHVDRTAAAATQYGSKPVSGRGLRKTGIFRRLPRDFRRFRRESGQIRSLETDNQFAKARYWRAFLRLLRVESPGAGLVGWSERIRTRAFPIEPGLCVSFPEFGNMAGGVRRRPFAANSGLANGESSEFSQPKPDRHLQRRRRHAAPSLRRPNSNAGKDLMP